MKILKPGKVEQRKFVCPNCGCEFAASENELEKDGVFGTYSTICPNLECGEHITGVRGEPYEEPTDQDDIVEKIADLIYSDFATDADTAWKIGEHLVRNGVTFKEE